MKKHLFVSLSLIAALSGCSTNEEVERSDFKALSFETFVGKGTRAVARTAFADGDNFGVFAYEHGTDTWSAATTSKKLFMDNIKVFREGGSWTYSPTKYWKDGVKHTFLAYSPYNETYVQDPKTGTLIGVTTEALASNQTDLLYTIPEQGSRDLEWEEGRTVTMTFRHALSQIKVSIATDEDYSGYYTAVVRQIQLTGIVNSGNLDLNEPDADTSPWSNQGNTVTGYEATVSGLDIPLTTDEVLLNDAPNLFMQIPQEIQDGQATFRLTCDITPTEAGNMAGTGTGKTVDIKIPGATWLHNHIYHYKVKINLQQLLGLKPIEVGEPDVVLWEAGGENKLPKDLTVTIQPTSKEDAVQTGTGNALLGITKESTAGGEQTVEIKNPEKEDQWMVEVGPEIADAEAPVTRAEKPKPADWVRVCRSGEESNLQERLYGTDDATVKIKITKANVDVTPRQAEVTIRRALSGVTRILVTQAKAEAAIIEANSTQFTKNGGSNQLTITNPATTTQWTLSKSEGADWLSLKSADGQSDVTSGYEGASVLAVATPNITASVRTATITLSRSGQEDVKVEVTQEAPEPMTVSAAQAVFQYSGGSQTLTITNPEAADNTFQWKLTGNTANWFTVTPTSGTGNKTDQVTITAKLNTGKDIRYADLTLTRQGQENMSIRVGQLGANDAYFTPTSFNVDYAAHPNLSFNVICPQGINWNLSCGANWVTLRKTQGNGTSSVYIDIAESADYQNERTATITLTRDGQSTHPVFTVKQGKAPVPKTTVTPTLYNLSGDGTFYFEVNAPQGKTWTARFYEPDIYIINQCATFETGVKEFTHTGPYSLKVNIKNLTATYKRKIGIFYIYVEGEEGIDSSKRPCGGFTYH